MNMIFGLSFFFACPILAQLGSIDNAAAEAATEPILLKNSRRVCLSILFPFAVLLG
jgi:hypothetical protein